MTKKRVQIDAFVIGAFMIIVGILVLRFPGMYLEGKSVRDIFDVVGFAVIIIGALLRMAGRGYKKFASQQSNRLATGGPYKLVRNPMYLGTFLVGVGFMFPLYPLWTTAIFATVFYLRFIVQIREEEAWLKNTFGREYEEYCRRIPAFIPTLRSLKNVSLKEVFPWECLWTTKEKYGLLYWPVLSVILGLLQERFLWGGADFRLLAVNGVVVVLILSWMLCRIMGGKQYVL